MAGSDNGSQVDRTDDVERDPPVLERVPPVGGGAGMSAATRGAARRAVTAAGTATYVDAQALVTAMGATSVREPAVDKGKLPYWDSKTERFNTFSHRVELWLRGHGLLHLLTDLPTGPEMSVHDKCMTVVCLALPASDLDYIRGSQSISAVWTSLKSKYMPSQRAEIRTLLHRFNHAICQYGKVEQHCTNVKTIVNQLAALGAKPPANQIVTKLLDLGDDPMYIPVRLQLQESEDVEHVISMLTDQSKYMDTIRLQQGYKAHPGNRYGGNRDKPGPPPRKVQPPIVAAISAGEDRVCWQCNKKGHLRQDCPDLSAEVRKFLANEPELRKKRRQRGKKHPTVAVITLSTDFSGDNAESLKAAADLYNLLVDSGADVNIIRNAELFVNMRHTSLESVQPVGDECLNVIGVGTIHFRLGFYTDNDSNRHPVDVELPNCYYVPDCPFNILSTEAIKDQNIFLHTRSVTKGGDYVVFPGFSNQVSGHRDGDVSQSHDESGDPILVYHTKPGKPVLCCGRTNSPAEWDVENEPRQQIIVEKQLTNSVAAVSAQLRRSPAYELSPTFLAHLSMLSGKSVLKLMANNPLYGVLNVDKECIEQDVSKCHGCKLAALRSGARGDNDAEAKRGAKHPGEVLHADLMGPVVPMGVGKARYLLVVVDEFTRYTFACPMSHKHQAARLVCEIIEHVSSNVLREVEPGKQPEKVRILYSDKGGEFTVSALADYISMRGMTHVFTATAEHPSNGLIERAIGVLQEHMRAAMLPSRLTHRLWPEVAMTAAHAGNLVPHTGVQRDVAARHAEQQADKWVEDNMPLAHRTATVQQGGVQKPGKKNPKPELNRKSPQFMSLRKKGKEVLYTEKMAALKQRDMWECVPYLAFYRGSLDNDKFDALLKQMLPYGTPVYFFVRNDKLRHLDPRSCMGVWVGPGQGPHMNRVYEPTNYGGRVLEVRQMTITTVGLRAFASNFDAEVQFGGDQVDPVDDEFTVPPGMLPEKVADAEVPTFCDALAELTARKERMKADFHAKYPWDHDSIGHRLQNLHMNDKLDDDLCEEGLAPEVRSPKEASGELQATSMMRRTPDVVSEVAERVRQHENHRRSSDPRVAYEPRGELVIPKYNFSKTNRVVVLEKARGSASGQERLQQDWSMGSIPRAVERAVVSGQPLSGMEHESQETVSVANDEISPPPASADRGLAQPAFEGAAGLHPSVLPPPPTGAMDMPGEPLMSNTYMPELAREVHGTPRSRREELGGFISGGKVSPSSPSAGDSMHPPAELAVYADAESRRPKWNPLVRKRLIPRANVAAINAGVQSSDVSEGTVAMSKAGCSKDTEATADCVVSPAEVAEHKGPVDCKNTRRGESRRVAAIRKRKPSDPDMPSLKEGLAGPRKAEWMQAMIEEVNALSEHGTYELVELPRGAKAISGKWVFKIKRGPTGEIERYKARYVARGFTQEEGVDFFQTWAPVGSYATLRVLLSICAQENLEMKHVDIQCAFLNGKLEEEVYVEQPQVLNDKTKRVWRLLKTLYGLKQAAREWHKELARLLAKMGFHRSAADPALYVRKTGRCFIFLWVDDLFIFSEPTGLKELIDEILTVFEGRNLGDLSWALGAALIRDRKERSIVLSQKQKVINLLEKFGMSDCRKSPTPLVPKQKLRSANEHPELEKASVAEHSRFMSAVGGIQYLAVVTRPDLSYSCNALAKQMGGSLKEHWDAVQHVLRYLQSTVDIGMEFKGSGEMCLVL